MASVSRAIRPIVNSSRGTHETLCNSSAVASAIRSFSCSSRVHDAQTEQTQPPMELDPNTVMYPHEERKLWKAGVTPIGSRRRRAALQSSQNLPFEQLPYQCFQDARRFLQEDREKKIKQIEIERERLARIRAQDAAVSGGEQAKMRRIVSIDQYIHELKILADINDPLVKKRFEDGEGDMNRPIYRHLADKKWRSYNRKVLVQRVEQFHVVPDYLMKIDPVYDVTFSFGRKKIKPGEILPSELTEFPPSLNVQVFDKGERFVTVAVIDGDVPDFPNDRFTYRLQFLASNIPVSPTSPQVHLGKLSEDQTIMPWLPPVAQKGSPYHRQSIFILTQEDGHKLDPAAVREWITTRDRFKLRSLLDRWAPLTPDGVTIFRSIWDEGTASVMARAGIKGADVQLKKRHVEPLPYRKKNTARYR